MSNGPIVDKFSITLFPSERRETLPGVIEVTPEKAVVFLEANGTAIRAFGISPKVGAALLCLVQDLHDAKK